ncbi:MAG: putative toxin-antitoxin system toxin component, PIN family [Armatimonadota bacterium]|nr:putative toxin-antitoxin system toxin component, PIN family [bacterium]
MSDILTVVLDTNVFVAAYWARSSASARLVQACIDGYIRAFYSPEVKREVMHVLQTVKVSQQYLDLMECFWQSAVAVDGVSVAPLRSPDPDDQKFLEAAAGGGVDYLVTNDDHLLGIGYVGRTEILKPVSILRVIGL